MKNNLLFLIVISIFSFPLLNFGQVPNLGTAANFVLFTTTGAVGSTGVSNITGNVGSGAGAITGFGGLNGLIYNADAVTTQASSDLLVAYNQLNSEVATFFPGPVLGDGQVLTAGVYFLPAAASLDADLTLDAQGDANAVFIFLIGGAFSTNASSGIFLVNGALASNVFWKVEGAVPMAAGTTMRGTIIANNAAISLGAGGILEGRALSTTGAVSIYGSLAYILPGGGTILPVGLLSFTGVCINQQVLLNWSTAAESNNNYFTVERSIEQKNWMVVETIEGAGNSSSVRNYSYTDKPPIEAVSFYRLKQTDFDGNTNYGNTILVKKCEQVDSENLILYPNPSTSGKFKLSLTGDKSQVISVEIFNALGERVYGSAGFQSYFDLSDQSTGVYFVQVRLNSKTITLKVMVKE
ncbi:MAG TPA: ice-binding family protein [Puia sp.]|nr:ice-binding family protein [Puia sp.]